MIRFTSRSSKPEYPQNPPGGLQAVKERRKGRMTRSLVKFLLAATAAATMAGGVAGVASAAPMPAHPQVTTIHALRPAVHAGSSSAQPAGIQRTAESTLTALVTRDGAAPQVVILNHATTVIIANVAANADSLATICGTYISAPGICDVITLLAQPIQALGPPGPDDCLAFAPAAAIPPFTVAYLTC
jgi:hypothetical protein